jgi:hypothetical protein
MKKVNLFLILKFCSKTISMQKYIAQLNDTARTRITKGGPMIIVGAGSVRILT